jgi:hypothetical protein
MIATQVDGNVTDTSAMRKRTGEERHLDRRMTMVIKTQMTNVAQCW